MLDVKYTRAGTENWYFENKMKTCIYVGSNIQKTTAKNMQSARKMESSWKWNKTKNYKKNIKIGLKYGKITEIRSEVTKKCTSWIKYNIFPYIAHKIPFNIFPCAIIITSLVGDENIKNWPKKRAKTI